MGMVVKGMDKVLGSMNVEAIGKVCRARQPGSLCSPHAPPPVEGPPGRGPPTRGRAHSGTSVPFSARTPHLRTHTSPSRPQVMENFEKSFEDMDVRSEYVEQTMN